jgi:hypothetical protein
MIRVVVAIRLCAISASLLLCAGCGGGGPRLGSVSGVVTLDGKPVPNAFVTFTPEGPGRPSQAKTDTQGRYELQFSTSRDGALIGAHQVRVSTHDISDNDRVIPEIIPPRYHSQGSIAVTIDEGRNDVDLELFTNSE